MQPKGQFPDDLQPQKAEGMAVYPVVSPTHQPVGDVNMYLVDQGGDGLVLVDAGVNTDECFAILQETLRMHGFELRQIRQIWLTHNHPDHTGLVNRIARLQDVDVYAHRQGWLRMKRDPDFLEMRVRFYERLYREMGCGEAGERQVRYLREMMKRSESRLLPDLVPLSGGDEVAVLRVLEVPGHAPDHIAFWDPRRKWLFSGDVLLKHISSNAFVEPDERGNRRRTLLEQTESLKKLLELGPEKVFAGHGGIIGNAEELIRFRLSRIDQKGERLLGLVARRPQTAYELAKILYPEQHEKQFGPVMSEIIGMLDYLEAKGKIGKSERAGVWYYEAMDQKGSGASNMGHW